MQFNHFLIIVYGSFLLPWKPNRDTDHDNISYFKLSLPKQRLYKIRVILSSGGVVINIPFLKFNVSMATKPKKKNKKKKKKKTLVIKHTNWVDYHPMIISAKYGSHHFTGYALLSFFHYKSMRAFCCHGNQTKRQITMILAILSCPFPSNICTKLVILPQWFWRRRHKNTCFKI